MIGEMNMYLSRGVVCRRFLAFFWFHCLVVPSLAWTSFWPCFPKHQRLTIKTATTETTTRLKLAPQQLGSFETLNIAKEDRTTRTVRVESYLNGKPYLDYQEAWDRQRTLWQAHADRLSSSSSTQKNKENHNERSLCQFDGYDTIMLVQHQPVYTLGTASDESFIHDTATTPIQRINRGGEVTYHGPGQLTVYPVLDLRAYRQDVHWYMRALEQVVILALRYIGIPHATRDEQTTGVWVDNRKVAAVGVHARRWITQHGLAINVTPQSLPAFQHIVPCGLEGRKVGCVQQFITDSDDRVITVQEMANAVQRALEEVFCVELIHENEGKKI